MAARQWAGNGGIIASSALAGLPIRRRGAGGSVLPVLSSEDSFVGSKPHATNVVAAHQSIHPSFLSVDAAKAEERARRAGLAHGFLVDEPYPAASE